MKQMSGTDTIMNQVHMNLAQLDLNLLFALDVLLRERSVTRAAERLGTTQSALSHSLRRLREALGDPLLVRGRGGMVATPRAEALERSLGLALSDLARAIDEPAQFDPKHTSRVFRLASPDLFDTLVLPRLLAHFGAVSPNAAVAALPGFQNVAERLEAGELDVAIAPIVAKEEGAGAIGLQLSPDLRTRRLFEDRFRPYVRSGHPVLSKGRVSANAFVNMGHVLVSPTGRGAGVVDVVLERRKLTRRITARVPDFACALAIVRDTDLVLVGPGAIATRAEEWGVAELPLALRLPTHALSRGVAPALRRGRGSSVVSRSDGGGHRTARQGDPKRLGLPATAARRGGGG